MLREHSDVDRHSHWADVKRKVDSDARYKAVDSSGQREDWFREYCKMLKEEKKKAKEKDREHKRDKEKHKKKDKDKDKERHSKYHAKVFTLHLGSNSLVDDDDNRVTLGASYSVPHPDYDPSDLETETGRREMWC
jgi:Mg-chelatase subunit ChlI